MSKPFKKEYSLAYLMPDLAKEWDYEKNYPLTPEKVFLHGRKMVGWICKGGHKFMASLVNRGHGSGCPYCCGRKVCEDNCLAILRPDLIKEWDHTKNKQKGLTPLNVTSSSTKIANWICDKGHTYEASISVKSGDRSTGCPYCHGTKICADNCLATQYPLLAKEWHPAKNKKNTPHNVALHSSKKAWWKCLKCGHEWEAQIYCRSNGNGCPACNKVQLKDGTVCDSLPEAYYYLRLKDRRVKFNYHVKIGLGRRVCDFYIPSTNRYIEVTGYNKNSQRWQSYHKNILRKKRYIIKALKAKFKFIQLKLTPKQFQYVRENTI